MPVEISRLSREYIFYKVDTPNDISNATAEVAYMSNPVDLPEEPDWREAILVLPADPLGDGENIHIAILMGPGGTVELPYGDYQEWVRITDTVERPVRRVGVVTVT